MPPAEPYTGDNNGGVAVSVISATSGALIPATYLRPAELEALDWIDFDVGHEQVTIQRSISRELGTDKAPKNGMARLPMSIEPELMPLLKAMRRHSDTKMTEHYIHTASVLNKARYGQPFPSLPRGLLGDATQEAPPPKRDPAWSKLLN